MKYILMGEVLEISESNWELIYCLNTVYVLYFVYS